MLTVETLLKKLKIFSACFQVEISVLTNDINLGMLQKCGLQENIIQYSRNIFLFCEYA